MGSAVLKELRQDASLAKETGLLTANVLRKSGLPLMPAALPNFSSTLTGAQLLAQLSLGYNEDLLVRSQS